MLVRLHFPRVAPCTGAGMVTPMPVTRRLWAPITFVTIALAACKGTEPFVPVATTLHVAPSSLSFTSLGATRQVVAVVLDQRADTIKHASVVWASDNSGVATVSASGLVTAVGNGSAHAVATSGGLSAQVTVSVAQAAAQLIKASGDGQTGVVRATLPSALALEVVDAGNRPMTGVTVTFTVTLGGGSLSNPSGRGRRDGVGRRDPNRRERCGDGRTLDARCRRGTEYADRDRGGVRNHRQPGHLYGHGGAAECARQRVGGPRRRPDGAHGVRSQHPAGGRGAGRGEPPRPQRGGHLRGGERRGERRGRERADGSRPRGGVMPGETACIAGATAAGQRAAGVRHGMGHVRGVGTIWPSLGLRPGEGGPARHFVGAEAARGFERDGGPAYSAGAKVRVRN